MPLRTLLLPIGLMLISAARLFGADASELPSKQAPAWAADAVWYQIFPDRFCNGDPGNDPTRDTLETPIKPGPDWQLSSWTADWYARDAWETALGPDFYKNGVLDRRYGGDLQGVLDKLDYLKNLGINALYFNPLFYARSLHKYDGGSYHHIDPNFGPDPKSDLAEIEKETNDTATWQWTAADKLFLKVIKEAHARGMKVIIDGVFNHTGRSFFAFKDLIQRQQDSPYKNWYVVNSFDDPATKRNEFDYKAWWGYKSLPVFASANNGHDVAAGPKEYIFNATRRWMDPDGKGNPANGVDGWRLDAADERPVEFWADWNALVRQINPDAFTSAEVWKDPKSFILKGGFSAVMNYYGFAIPVKGWLIDNHLTPTRFAKDLDDRRNALPRADAYVMQNLIDSHDTDRLASMIVNGPHMAYHDDPEQVEYNSNDAVHIAPNYLIRQPNEHERAIQRMVVLMQMSYVGAPMIYYGDETGMWGATDPDDRQPMVWEDMKFDPQTIDPRGGSEEPQAVRFDKDVFGFYQGAIAFRHAHDALTRGDYKLLNADDDADVMAFARRGVSETLFVAFNRGDTSHTVAMRTGPGAGDAAVLAKPGVLFSTADADSPASAKANGDTVSILLPPWAAVVVGAAKP